MSKKASAILVTGDGIRHRYVACRIATDLNLLGVIFEAKKINTRNGKSEEDIMINRHFSARDQAEVKYFAKIADTFPSRIDCLDTANNTVNSDSIYDWIIKKNPEYLVLFGSGIIKERLLNAFIGKSINMHLGLSPYYRGAGTNMWPLVNSEPECIGVTIHLAELAVDAGPILRQARPDIRLGDTIHDIGCKTIRAGAEILGGTINDYHTKSITPIMQDLSKGGVYRIADFSGDALRIIFKNYGSGMIKNHLNNIEKRLSRFPIIE